MVHFKEDKLIIELEHPVPKDALKELQSAIINSLQVISDIPPQDVKWGTNEGNYILYELLKQTMDLKT